MANFLVTFFRLDMGLTNSEKEWNTLSGSVFTIVESRVVWLFYNFIYLYSTLYSLEIKKNGNLTNSC